MTLKFRGTQKENCLFLFCHHQHLRNGSAASSLKHVLQMPPFFGSLPVSIPFTYIPAQLQLLGAPGPGPLTSSWSTVSLGDLIWSLAKNATFRLLTCKFIFSALTSPLNSCHFYPSAYWTSSFPFLIPTHIVMWCPKLNSLFSLLSQSSPSSK